MIGDIILFVIILVAVLAYTDAVRTRAYNDGWEDGARWALGSVEKDEG